MKNNLKIIEDCLQKKFIYNNSPKRNLDKIFQKLLVIKIIKYLTNLITFLLGIFVINFFILRLFDE